MKVRFLEIAAIVLFAVFMIAPVGAIIAIGPASPYGASAFQPLNIDSGLLSSESAKREAFVQAILSRSDVRKMALKSYYWTQYNIFNTVDADRIFSGRDRWLFLKGQFQGCLDDVVLRQFLESIEISTAFANASGIDLIVSISPNKSSLYSEMLRSRDWKMTHCGLQNASRWRELAAQYSSPILDHLPSLIALKRELSEEGNFQPVYFQTDTHWRTYAAPVVVEDLLRAFGKDPDLLEPVLVDVGLAERQTDMYNVMLLQSGLSTQPQTLAIPQEPPPHFPTMVVRDSFYGRIAMALESVFNESRVFHIFHDRDEIPTALREFQGRLVVNSVERDAFRYFGQVESSQLTHMLKDRIAAAATDCSYQVISPSSLHFENISFEGDTLILEPDSVDPQIILPLGGSGRECLRVNINVEQPTIFQIFLPPLLDKADAAPFVAGRSLLYQLQPGSNEIALVIPPELEGVWRLDPVGGKITFVIESFEIGVRPGHS